MDVRKIIDMYVHEDLSTYVIAEKFNTYPNKIRRVLIKNGIPLKDRSAAQKLALESGRNIHPTAGKGHDISTKEKISESIYNSWTKISDEERELRSQKGKDQWDSMSEEEKAELRDAAAKAVRQASVDGSKMEKFLLKNLQKNGYDILFHKKGLIPNDKLEVDIFIPALKTAIEIDGPAHFLPIWGEENLQKHIKADSHKSGLLLSAGFVVIRIKHITRNLSEKHKRTALSEILSALNNIKEKFPDKGNRYIEIEIS